MESIFHLIEHLDFVSILFWASLILVMKFFSFFIAILMKIVWLKKLGFSRSEVLVLFLDRKSDFDLNLYLEKSSDLSIRMVDAIARKFTHFFHMLATLLIANCFISNSSLAGVSVILASLTSSLFLLYLYSKNTLLARISFGATARIRDGQQARKNYLVAQCLGFVCSIFVGTVVFLVLLSEQGISNHFLVIFSYFIFLPVSVGDALGEIVGSFSKQNIPVKGIGEINRKSTTGTIAVFLGSFVSLVWVTYVFHLSLNYYFLALLVSTATTIVELKSPRSTDSFFIPAVNTLICLAWYLFLIA